jgi:hypothetical protein
MFVNNTCSDSLLFEIVKQVSFIIYFEGLKSTILTIVLAPMVLLTVLLRYQCFLCVHILKSADT